MAMSAVSTPNRARLADPSLRRAVEAAVRRRVRGDEAEDVVQATFTDVLAAPQLPEDDAELRRFVFGVARNKVFDHFRQQKRQPEELSESETAGADCEAVSARDMLRWAEAELADPEARVALQWMLREGDGEKLEHIARDASVPAPRVRKRVSRLRKLLRERWAAELMLAGLGALLLLAAGALYLLSYGRSGDVVKREPPRPLPSVLPAPRSLPSAAPPVPESRPALAPSAERRAPTAKDSAPTPSARPSAIAPTKPPPRLKTAPNGAPAVQTSQPSKVKGGSSELSFSPDEKK